MQFLVEAGANIKAQLSKMSKAFPKSGKFFAEAQQTIDAGVAAALTSGPGAVTTSPTETGPNFTGTGSM